MPASDRRDRDETDEGALVERAGQGDAAERQCLLGLHRDRLRRMVDLRLDGRLGVRVDPSDIVQEALLHAARNLDDYLRDQPVPFYAWLRRFAWERLVEAHRRHVLAGRRSVIREHRDGPGPPLSDPSV
jgi:RNA polymerase sigma-70 factor (ECF subfamily)